MCYACLFSSQVFTYHCTLTVWILIHGTMENQDALSSLDSQGYWMSKNAKALFDAAYLFQVKENVNVFNGKFFFVT